MALTISSFSKLLSILMVIWDYSRIEYARIPSLLEFTSNLEAVSGRWNCGRWDVYALTRTPLVFLDANLKTALPILACGVAARWTTQYVFIQLTGNIVPFSLIVA
jgi:hypothetical protein